MSVSKANSVNLPFEYKSDLGRSCVFLKIASTRLIFGTIEILDFDIAKNQTAVRDRVTVDVT